MSEDSTLKIITICLCLTFVGLITMGSSIAGDNSRGVDVGALIGATSLLVAMGAVLARMITDLWGKE